MYYNPETEKKIDELMSKMTLHEKVGQLNQVGPSPVGGFEISEEEAAKMLESGKITKQKYDSIVNHTMLDHREDDIRNGSIGSFLGIDDLDKANHLQRIAVEESRLGIPLIMGMDVIHGHKTIFPIPLAESCAFHDESFARSSEVAAKEAAEDGIHWTFAPMVDIGRDARWGRVAEGPGEDTYLASRFAAAKVKGFQGNDLKDRDHIAACIKHYAAYGAVEAGRDYDTVDMSLAKFYETYLPPYAAGVKAGAATVMAAFNDLSGVPCTTNSFLLKEVLREQLGFDGFVVSDANGVAECVNHGTASSWSDAAQQAVEAGCDMDLGSGNYISHLENLVESGEMDIKDIEESVRNILRIKFALGLFDNPYTEKREVSSKLCDEHRKAAYDIAKRCIVLLKNEKDVLPLSKEAKVAVLGACANRRDDMHGTWCCSSVSNSGVSIVDALESRNIDYKFSDCCSEYTPLNESAMYDAIEGADIVIAAVSYHCSGEAQSRCQVTLSADQQRMLDLLAETGKQVVTVLINGRPIALTDVVAKSDALVEAWHLGTEAGNAIADVLFGDYNPTGRLTATVPYYDGQWPIYYNRPSTGRPASDELWTNKYIDAPLQPLYPFGFGLSYTTYEYGEINFEANGDELTVSVPVTNIGSRAGEETVQLYIHRKKATRVRPVRELKGYQKVWLEPNETKTVSITVTREELGYYDMQARLVTTESEFDIWMAHDSSCGSHGAVTF